MATVLQSTHAFTSTSVTSITCTFPNAVTAGSLLVCYGGSGAVNTTLTASDNTNGAYNRDSLKSSGQGAVAILTFPNAVNGSPSPGPGPTVTLTCGVASRMVIIIEEWSGVLTVSPLDQIASAFGAAVTTGTGGTTGALAVANELCLTACMLSNAAGGTGIAVQSPWTVGPSSPWGTDATNGAYLASGYYQPVATTGVTATFIWTNSVGFNGCTATYELAAASSVAGQLPRQLYVMPRAAHRPSPTRKRWWWQNGILVPA